MKLIAKTFIGREYCYSKKECFYAPDSSAEKMAEQMTAIKYKIEDGQKWHVYDQDWYTDTFCFRKLYYWRGELRAKSL